MHVDVRKQADVVIVDFNGRMVMGVGDGILIDVVNELLTEGYRSILLNFTEVEFIDSSGLGELVQGYKAAQRSGATLKLLKPQERIRKTLNLTRLLPLFEVHENEQEALASFATTAGA